LRRADRRAGFDDRDLVLQALERVNAETGALTVVITHNVVIGSMADRVINLRDGRISGERHNAERSAAAGLHW